MEPAQNQSRLSISEVVYLALKWSMEQMYIGEYFPVSQTRVTSRSLSNPTKLFTSSPQSPWTNLSQDESKFYLVMQHTEPLLGQIVCFDAISAYFYQFKFPHSRGDLPIITPALVLCTQNILYILKTFKFPNCLVLSILHGPCPVPYLAYLVALQKGLAGYLAFISGTALCHLHPKYSTAYPR